MDYSTLLYKRFGIKAFAERAEEAIAPYVRNYRNNNTQIITKEIVRPPIKSTIYTNRRYKHMGWETADELFDRKLKRGTAF